MKAQKITSSVSYSRTSLGRLVCFWVKFLPHLRQKQASQNGARSAVFRYQFLDPDPKSWTHIHDLACLNAGNDATLITTHQLRPIIGGPIDSGQQHSSDPEVLLLQVVIRLASLLNNLPVTLVVRRIRIVCSNYRLEPDTGQAKIGNEATLMIHGPAAQPYTSFNLQSSI